MSETALMGTSTRGRDFGACIIFMLVTSLVGCGSGGANTSAPTTSAPLEPITTVHPHAGGSPATTRPDLPSTTTTAVSEWQTIGNSVQGRPIRMRRLGNGPRKVIWIGGIHGDEPEGKVATEQLPQAFTDAGLVSSVTLLLIEDLNPDGRAADTRGNANGVDLNRNFPADDFDSSNPDFGGSPLSQPEALALHDLVVAQRPALVLVAHGWRGESFINFDGPADVIASSFAKLSGMTYKPSTALTDPTPGSLGTWVGIDLGIPILTVEYLRGSDSAADWDLSKTAILGAIDSR